jgi:hypothetical protein
MGNLQLNWSADISARQSVQRSEIGQMRVLVSG